MAMRRHVEWIVRPDESDATALDGAADGSDGSDGISPLVSRLLAQRGVVGEDEVKRFLYPRLADLSDPFQLPQMSEAVERVLRAIDEQETVVLYGDYDVDGVTSITLMVKILEAYGLNPGTLLPSRMDEGYGLSIKGLERCFRETTPSLVIAVDCGTSSLREAEWLKEKGVDLVILDHHEGSPAGRPECVALVNPKLGDDFHYLCSAGVVFKLGHALLKIRPVPDFDLRDVLDIVAVGTVADIVPLVDENRILVRKGLQQLGKTGNHGLRALKGVASVSIPVTSTDVGFRLGPRLNAAGRIDSAQASLDLLLADSDGVAERHANSLDDRNRERKSLEERIQREANDQLKEIFDHESDSAIVIGSESWHPGVIGIVAARICRLHHRPTFVIAFDDEGIGKGSGRSVKGISLVDAIRRCDDLLLQGGGHDMAAGISIEREQLHPFRERMGELIGEAASNGELIPKIHIDAETKLRDLDLDLLESYELLQPFGSANPEPVFLCRGVSLSEEPRVLKEKHLKLSLMQDGALRSAMWFNAPINELPSLPWDIAFTIDRNTFRGRTSLSIMIQAVRSVE